MDTDQHIRTERRRTRNPRRWIWQVLTGVALVSAVVVLVTLPDAEPEVEGAPLSVHLSLLALLESSEAYQTAVDALDDAGTNALPIVLRIIQQPEPWYISLYFQQQTNMPKWLEQQARKQLDPWFHRNRLQGAIRAVGILGTNAAPIANELVVELPRLENSGRTPLSESLVKIGPAVVEPIKPLLTSTNMRTRSLAAYVCYMLNTRAADAAPELADGLLDGDANHQRLVGQTLARMGREATPVVLKLMTKTNPVEILAGLRGAEGIIPHPPKLVEKILFQLDNKDGEIRRTAALLIAQRSPMDIPAIQEKLTPRADENILIAEQLESLRMIGANQERWLEVMREGVHVPDIGTRLQFANELVRRNIIDNELIEFLQSCATENTRPEPLQRMAQVQLDRIERILSARARTNSHPDTVRASQSSP